MKYRYIIKIGIALYGLTSLFSCKTVKYKNSMSENMKTIYDFKVTDINSVEFDFSSLKGKKIMIVNTASKCGLTPQYYDLQELYTKYKDSNFVIVGFPANDFMSQEPGTNDEIESFCQLNYGVTFPMMGKISVKGDDMHILYQYLTQKKWNHHSDNKVEWNFQKYLINEEGLLEKVIAPTVQPDDKEIIDWIEK